MAVQFAMDNPEAFGSRFEGSNLVWEVVSVEEGDAAYDIRLAYRPGGRFSGEPGVALFTVHRAGRITLNEVLSRPRRNRGPLLPLIIAGAVAVLVLAGIGAALVTVLSGGNEADSPAVAPSRPSGPTPAASAAAPPSLDARRLSHTDLDPDDYPLLARGDHERLPCADLYASDRDDSHISHIEPSDAGGRSWRAVSRTGVGRRDHPHADSDPDARANSVAHADSYHGAYTDANANTDPHAHTNADVHSDAKLDGHADSNAYPGGPDRLHLGRNGQR